MSHNRGGILRLGRSRKSPRKAHARDGLMRSSGRIMTPCKRDTCLRYRINNVLYFFVPIQDPQLCNFVYFYIYASSQRVAFKTCFISKKNVKKSRCFFLDYIDLSHPFFHDAVEFANAVPRRAQSLSMRGRKQVSHNRGVILFLNGILVSLEK